MKQLITFFSLAYLLSWIIWLPLYGPAFGMYNLPTIPYHHGIGALGPLISSFVTTWIYYRQKGVNELLKKCLQVRSIIYLLIALFGPALLVVMASFINNFVNNDTINFSGMFSVNEFPHLNFMTFFIYNLVFFGFGEETGWRGFALPRLQSKYNALTSSLILTVLWALWHWPLFFYRPGYTTMDFAGICGWIFSLLTGSILLTWLCNSTKGSILICAIFHSTVDMAFTSDIAKNIVNYMGFLITVWGILTIIILKPKNLSTIERVKIS